MTEWTIDKVCRLTSNPALLNALHACREGHPWNKTMDRPWLRAWFIAAQQPSYEFSNDALHWLQQQVRAEAQNMTRLV